MPRLPRPRSRVSVSWSPQTDTPIGIALEALVGDPAEPVGHHGRAEARGQYPETIQDEAWFPADHGDEVRPARPLAREERLELRLDARRLPAVHPFREEVAPHAPQIAPMREVHGDRPNRSSLADLAVESGQERVLEEFSELSGHREDPPP